MVLTGLDETLDANIGEDLATLRALEISGKECSVWKRPREPYFVQSLGGGAEKYKYSHETPGKRTIRVHGISNFRIATVHIMWLVCVVKHWPTSATLRLLQFQLM
jgi:hypothetical protein